MADSRLRKLLQELAAGARLSRSDEAIVSRARRRLRRNVAISALASLAVVAGAITAVQRLADRVSQHPIGSPTSVSARDGNLICKASLDRDVLRPGQETGLHFTLMNDADSAVMVRGFHRGFLVVKNATGEELFDSSTPLDYSIGRAPGAISLPAHGSIRLVTLDAVVRWQGSLRLVPVCDALSEHPRWELPPIDAHVGIPGGHVSDAEAVEHVLETTEVFKHCRPGTDGRWTVGVVTPPIPSPELEPIRARCKVAIEGHEGFSVVELFVVAPADAAVDFSKREYRLPDRTPGFALRWGFVATPTVTTEAFAWSFSRTATARGTSRSFRFEGGEWNAGGEGLCGTEGFGAAAFFDWFITCRR